MLAERDLSDFMPVDGKLVGYDSGIDFRCHFVQFKQWYKIIYGKVLIQKEKDNTIIFRHEKKHQDGNPNALSFQC